ncbi:MAG: nickel pincer cofactor biosynthesis protein LarC [Planctomycetes bacterium]|nr:nickel pincer cofactor biosynthesis protein LarC [Planctomycetota bacterium]
MILFIEPSGGLAGDMFLAALLDLEDPRFTLPDLEVLARALVPESLRLVCATAERGGFRVRTLDVRTDESEDPPHRHLAELLERLEASPLSAAARARAGRILRRLAEAEARVHGVDVEEVHFHEVGAIDTLIDVGGAALALERLGIERVLATTPYVGGGTVRCAHGELPVPAPGTAELLRGLPQRRGPGGERVTPTGAALLAELVERFEPEEALIVERAGLGGGQRDPEEGPANFVRVSLCTAPRGAEGARRAVDQLECNLDDASGEELGFLVEELRAAGALDAWIVAVQMKKGRPGSMLQALCRPAGRAALEGVLFAHSPTLGLRWIRCERVELEREAFALELHGQSVRMKLRRRAGEPMSDLDLSAEHDDLARLARATGRDLRSLEREALAAARARLQPDSALRS